AIAPVQRAENGLRELPGFDVVIEAVLVVAKRLVALDGLPADERNGPGKCCFIGAKAVPSVALRRPDKPGARTAREIFRSRKTAVLDVNPDTLLLQLHELIHAAFAHGAGPLQSAGKKHVDV